MNPNLANFRVKGIHFNKKGDEPWSLDRMVELGGYFQYKDVKSLLGQTESRLQKFIKTTTFPEGVIYRMLDPVKGVAQGTLYLNLPAFVKILQDAFMQKAISDSNLVNRPLQSMMNVMDLSRPKEELRKSFVAELAAELFLRCDRLGRTSIAEFVDDADGFSRYLQDRGFPTPNRLF